MTTTDPLSTPVDVSPETMSATGVRAQKLAFSELSHIPAANAPLAMPGLASDVPRASNPLHHVKARLTVCVGTVEMTVGELLGAKEHQVLRLDAAVDQPVDVLLEGQVVARGVLVAVDDRFGVRITELPRPLTP